jgi:hypothetical protein
MGYQRTVNLASIDRLLDGLGALAIHLAADAERRAEDLLDAPLQLLGERLEAHLPCNGDDLIERDGLVVLNVLLLLAIARGLLEGADDE